MYLENLISPKLAVLMAPHCFLRRLWYRDLVSFGLLANLAGLERRGLFRGIDGIIDVGANIGQFAYMSHTVWPRLPIYSFEPDKECFGQLQQTFTRFEIPGTCFQVAINDYAGESQFYVYDNKVNNSFLQRYDRTIASESCVTVSCATLDGLQEELSAVKSPMLKIDVQGSELSVLRGATSLLKRCKYVQIEVSLQHAYQGNAHIADVFAAMRDHGFRWLEILDMLRMPKAEGHGIREADLLFIKDSLDRLGQ